MQQLQVGLDKVAGASTRAMGAVQKEVEAATHERCSSSGSVEDFLELCAVIAA